MCFEALQRALHEAATDTKVFVMVGPQGAGKSSWVRSHLTGRPDAIAFDAILVQRAERKPIIDAAKVHGVEVIAVWMKTPLEICIARNAMRLSDELVGERAIRNVHAAIEPPGLDEGFAKIIEVESAPPMAHGSSASV